MLFSESNAVLWQTQTVGLMNVVFAVQNDGNLKLYSSTTTLWHSNTAEKIPLPPYKLVLFDGFLSYFNTPGKLIWSSAANPLLAQRPCLPTTSTTRATTTLSTSLTLLTNATTTSSTMTTATTTNTATATNTASTTVTMCRQNQQQSKVRVAAVVQWRYLQ